MANLRKQAQGRDCQIRIPNYCNHNAETSVLCHVRMAGTCGVGMKPNDLQGAIGCSSCHDVVDGRVKTEYSKEEIKTFLYEGMIRTQNIWIKEGVVKA